MSDHNFQVAIGDQLRDLHREQEAVAPLTRALAIAEASSVDPVLLADTRFGLARVISDRRRAVELARQARRAYEAAGAGAQKHLAELVRWLGAPP